VLVYKRRRHAEIRRKHPLQSTWRKTHQQTVSLRGRARDRFRSTSSRGERISPGLRTLLVRKKVTLLRPRSGSARLNSAVQLVHGAGRACVRACQTELITPRYNARQERVLADRWKPDSEQPVRGRGSQYRRPACARTNRTASRSGRGCGVILGDVTRPSALPIDNSKLARATFARISR
jgi:hypothetical protein